MNALAFGKLGHLAVLQVRVQLNLVGGNVFGTHRGNGFFHQRDGEVGHTDCSGQALLLGFQQRPHKLGNGHCVVGRWPVNQGQVQMLGAQFFQAVLEAGDQRVLAEVADPDLAGDVQLITGHAALGNGLAHVGFVLINLCGIHGAVTQFKGVFYRVDHHLAF